MHAGTAITTVDLPSFPAADPAAQGRLAALRALCDAVTGGDGRVALARIVTVVESSAAPAEFKDAFAATLHDLTRVLGG